MGDIFDAKMISKTKTQNTLNKVLSAIADMDRQGEKITFYAVAKRAGVSKAFLYQNVKARSTIEALRKKSEQSTGESKHYNYSDYEYLDAVTLKYENMKLKDRIFELESSNEALQAENLTLKKALSLLAREKNQVTSN